MSEQPPVNPQDPNQPAYGAPPQPAYGSQPPPPPVAPSYAPPPPSHPQQPPPGYPQAPLGYPPAPQGYPQQFAPPANNGIAIAALVVSIVALVLCWIPYLGLPLPLVAIGLAIAGLVRARKIGKGMGLAVTGLLIGLVALLAAVTITVFVTKTFGDCFKVDLTKAEQQTCLDNKTIK